MSEVKLPQMIDYYRKQNNLTMKQLGEKMDKSESAISKWIKGVRSPMIDDLEKLSIIFDVPIENLMFGGQVRSDIGDTVNIMKKLSQDRQAKVKDYANLQLLEQEQTSN